MFENEAKTVRTKSKTSTENKGKIITIQLLEGIILDIEKKWRGVKSLYHEIV
jgi:hypothetical protein